MNWFLRGEEHLSDPGRIDRADYGVRAGMMQRAKRSATLHAPAMIAALLCLPLAGCGMSSLTSGLGTGIFGGSDKSASGDPASVSEEQLLSAAKADVSGTSVGAIPEVAHGCPKVVVNTRDNNLTIYEPGRAGDGLAIMHRGEITKTARECQIAPGKVTVKYGFSGRVLMGPRGQSGMVNLPINITVVDSKREKVAADKMKIDTTIAVENPIGYFSAVRTVTFDVPEGARPGEFEVNIGFERNVPGAG